jgi:serine phosphatase RsbU (regulator of sigma subunit)
VPLEGAGPALGMLPDEVYTCDQELQLAPGDALLAFSDGLAEARSPDDPDSFLGEEGVREAFCRAMGESKNARDTTLELAELCMARSKGVNEDDITLVVVHRPR